MPDPQQTSDSDAAGADSRDLRKRAVGALGGSTAVLVIDRACQIVVLAILARLLTPEQTAVAAAAGLVVGAAIILNTFGIPAALIQSPVITQEKRAAGRTALLVLAVVCISTLEIFAPLAGHWFNNPEVTTAVRIMAFVILTQPLASIASAGLTRRLKAKDIALAEMGSSLAGAALVTIPLAAMDFGWRALVLGGLAQVVFKTLWLCLLAREPLVFGAKPRVIIDLFRRGSGFLSNGMLNRLGSDAPRWIIGRFLPGADLGLFSRANSLMSYPAMFFAAGVDRVGFAVVALVQSEPERLRTGALDGIRVTALLGLPLTVALVVLGPDIIRAVLGPDWLGAIAPFKILCIATYFRLAERLNWAIIRGTGRPYRLALLQAISLVLSVVGCLIGVKAGLAGVATAITVVFTISYSITTISAMRVAGIDIASWMEAHREGAASALLAAVVLTPLVIGLHRTEVHALVVILIAGAISAAVAAVAIWLAPKVFIGPLGLRLFHTARDLIWKR